MFIPLGEERQDKEICFEVVRRPLLEIFLVGVDDPMQGWWGGGG